MSQKSSAANKSGKKHTYLNMKKEFRKAPISDHPVREKQKCHSGLKSIEKLLNLNEDQKSKSKSYHSRDYSQFLTVSQWAAASPVLNKCSSHSYELSSNVGTLNGFLDHHNMKPKKKFKNKRNVLSLWEEDFRMKPGSGKSQFKDGRSLFYNPYVKTYEDICSSQTESYITKNLEKISLLKEKDRQLKLISNSSGSETTKQKKSDISYILRPKKRNRTSSEIFSKKKFRNVNSLKEFKKILKNFRIICEEDIKNKCCIKCEKTSHVVPAYFVLKLAENSEKPAEKPSSLSTKAQSFKLIFADDATENGSKEKLKSVTPTKPFTAENMKDKLKHTITVNNQVTDGKNRESTHDFEENNTDCDQCSGCRILKQNIAFQKELNTVLLEQVKTMLAQLSTMIQLLNDLFHSKSLNSDIKADEIIKENFLHDFSKFKTSNDEIIAKRNLDTNFIGACILHENLDLVYKGDFKEYCESGKARKDKRENSKKDIYTIFSPRKQKVYLPQTESEPTNEKQRRRKMKSEEEHLLDFNLYQRQNARLVVS